MFKHFVEISHNLFFGFALLFGLIESAQAQVKYQITNYDVEYTKGGNQNWDLAIDEMTNFNPK